MLLTNGKVKCWGVNDYGQLGLEDMNHRGDNRDMGDALATVDLGTGRAATAIDTGGTHTCALLDDETVKCWGYGRNGQLGTEAIDNRGNEPGEMGDALLAIDLGAGHTASAITAGSAHSCALLEDSTVRCWGQNDSGQVGLGYLDYWGDQAGEMGDALPVMSLGSARTATQIIAGAGHTCALLDDDTLKCWGANEYGQLGLGDTENRGDDSAEMGDNLPAVDLGAGRTAIAISAGDFHTCAVLDDASVKCWGLNDHGQLGLGDTADRGDEALEMGDSLPAVDLGTGRAAAAVATFGHGTCALLDDGTIRCWGLNDDGQLGLGDTNDRGAGAGEMGDELPGVDIGSIRN